MSERFVTRERVFFSASALTVAGLGAVAFKLIQRHREQEDDIVLEGVDQETADQLGARRMDPSDEPIEADVAYVGVDDHEERALTATEVHAIGEAGSFTKLRKRVINGAVYLYDVVKREG